MTEPYKPGDHFVSNMRRLERVLIIWTCAMILLAGCIGFLAGRFL